MTPMELLKRIYEKERRSGNCSFCCVDFDNKGKPYPGRRHKKGCLFLAIEAAVKEKSR